MSVQGCTLSGGDGDYCRDCRGCPDCLGLIALEDAQTDRYLAAGETVIVSALRPVRNDEDSEPRSRGRVAVRRRQREAGRGLMTYAEIDTAIAVVVALEDGTGDRATGEAAMAQLTRNGLDGQGRRVEMMIA